MAETILAGMQMVEMKKAFEFLDKNGDGRLSSEVRSKNQTDKIFLFNIYSFRKFWRLWSH